MLNWDALPYTVPLLLSGVVALGFGIYAARRRTMRGAWPFAWFCLAVAEWAFAYAMDIPSETVELKIAWSQVEYIGIVFGPLFWLAFALQYTRHSEWIPRRGWAFLSIGPLITLALVFTYPYHQLIWRTAKVVEVGSVPTLQVEYGSWFWVHTTFSYLCVLVGSLLLLNGLTEARQFYRRQRLALIVGIVTPWIGNILYIAKLSPIPGLDFTPLTATLGVVAVARAVFTFRMLDLAPMARRAMLDSMRDGVIALDTQNRIVDLNEEAARIIGSALTGVIGQPAGLVLRHEFDLDARFGDQVEAQAEITQGRGADARQYELQMAPLRDEAGEMLGRLITLHDITERKRVQQEIEELNAGLEARVLARTAELAAANQAQEAALRREQAARGEAEAAHAEAEAARRDLGFLAEASRLLANSLDESMALTGLTHHIIPTLGDGCVIHGMDAEGRFRRIAARHVDPEKTALLVQVEQHYVVAPDAPYGVRQVAHSHAPAFYPHVTDECLISLAADPAQLAVLRALAIRSYMCVPLVARERALGTITLLRGDPSPAYTPADVVLAQDLAQRIALALENAQLYRAAQQAVRIRDEFLSVASHELKTPITSLLLAVQAVQRITRHGTLPAPDYLTRRLTVVEDQGKRLGHLVNDLLDISRIVEGQLQLEPQAMDLAALVRQVIDQFQEELAEAGCAVTLAADAPVPGTWDPARIEQVLTNLLTNAMKYGRGQPITITVARAGAQARLVMRDEGIGIAPEHLERIFGRFERAVAPGKYGGMGLGLYIVRQIVEAHGGAISVVSAPGQGATFTMTLPLTPASPTDPT
jgi:PAS domain S-box-containing protein